MLHCPKLLKRKKVGSGLFLKSVSVLLLVGFVLQDISYADPGFAKPAQAWFAPKKITPVIPPSVARIQNSFSSTSAESAAQPTIYLVQDAHTNKSAQINIAKTIQHLAATENIKLVLLESGTGDDSISSLKTGVQGAAVKRIADAYLEKGWIQGPDYADLTGDSAIRLWGVEDKALYWKEIELYRSLKNERTMLNDYLDSLCRAVRTLKEKIYLPVLQLFDARREAFLNNDLSISGYLEVLTQQAEVCRIPLSDFPYLAVLKTVREKERGIDFKQSNEELRRAFESLGEDQQKELQEAYLKAKAIKDPSLTTASLAAFYLALEEKLGGQVMKTSYPHLAGYIDYLKEAEKLNTADVLDEKDNLEARLYENLIRTEDERRLHEISGNLEILRRLVNLKATSRDFVRFKADEKAFDAVEIGGFLNRKIMDRGALYEDAVFLNEAFIAAVKKASAFYEIADRRDEAFLKNAFKKMNDDRADKAILVTGGYHTEHLETLLKEKNISHVGITPQILSETNDTKYESILLGEAAVSSVGVLPAKELAVTGPGAGKLFVLREIEKELTAAHGARLSVFPGKTVKAAQQRKIRDISNNFLDFVEGFKNDPDIQTLPEKYRGKLRENLSRVQNVLIQFNLDHPYTYDKLQDMASALYIFEFQHVVPLQVKLAELASLQGTLELRKLFYSSRTLSKKLYQLGEAIFYATEDEVARRLAFSRIVSAVSSGILWGCVVIFSQMLGNDPISSHIIGTVAGVAMFNALRNTLWFSMEDLQYGYIVETNREDDENWGVNPGSGARLSQNSGPGRFSFRYWAANLDRYFTDQAMGPRARFIEKIRPLFERTSNVYETPGYEGKPDAYFLLGNHDIRGFKEFAKKWKEDTRHSGRKPIVIAGGIGNATEDLTRNLKKLYRPKLPFREREKLDELLLNGASEAEMVEFILNREGIPSSIGSKQIIYLEKLSTNTKENVLRAKEVFERLARLKVSETADKSGAPAAPRFNISVGTTKLHEERTYLTILEQWKLRQADSKERWAVKVEPFYDSSLEDYSDEEIINAVGFGFGYPANWKPQQTDVNRRSEIEKIEDYSGKETPDIAPSSRSKEEALKEILTIQKIRIQDFSEFIAATRSWPYRIAHSYLRLKVFLFKFWGGWIVYRFARKSIDADRAERVINRIVWETPYLDENGKVVNWEKTWLRVWEKEADREPNPYEKNKLLFLAQGFSEAEVENDDEPFSTFERIIYKISLRLFLAIFSHEPSVPEFKPNSDEVISVNRKLKDSYVDGRKFDYEQVGGPQPEISKIYISIDTPAAAPHDAPVYSYDDYANGRIPSVLTLPNEAQFPGPRPTVVFFHGITNRKEHPYMDGFEKYLVTHGFAVLRVDLPRHGEYEEGIYGPEFFTKEYFPAIRRFVQAHPRLQQKMALFGFSFGANTAFRIYLGSKAEKNEDVVAVVLLAPPINKSLGNPSSRGIKRFYKGARHIFIEANPVVILIKLSQYVFDLSNKSVRSLDYSPALVVYGRKDELVPNSDQTLIKKVVQRGGGKFIRFNDDDHYLSEKNYEEFCRVALKHIQQKFGMEETDIEFLPTPLERTWNDLVIEVLVFFKNLFRLPFGNGASQNAAARPRPVFQNMRKLRSLFENDNFGVAPQKLKMDLYVVRDELAEASASSQFTNKEASDQWMMLVRRINDLALKAQKMDFNRLDDESERFIDELKFLLQYPAFLNRIRLNSFLMRFVNAITFGDWEENTELFVRELQNKPGDEKLELRVLSYFADLLRLYPLSGGYFDSRTGQDETLRPFQQSMSDLLKEYDGMRRINSRLFNEALNKIEQTDALYKGIDSYKKGAETQPGYQLRYDPTHQDLWKLLRNRQAARDAAGARLASSAGNKTGIRANLRNDWGFWTSVAVFSASAMITITMIKILSHQGVEFPGEPSTPILLRDDAARVVLESYFELPPSADLNLGYHNLDFRARLAYFLSVPVLSFYYYLLAKGRVFPKKGVNAVLTGAIAGAGLFYNLEITYWLLAYSEFVVTNYLGKQYMNFQDLIWFMAFPLLGANSAFWWIKASFKATTKIAVQVMQKKNGKTASTGNGNSPAPDTKDKNGSRLSALTDGYLEEFAGKIETAFEVYFRVYKRITNRAARRFETKDWDTLQDDITSRIHYYTTTLNRFEAVTDKYLADEKYSSDTWHRLFEIYHKRAEQKPDAALAVAFFNSVMRRAVKKRNIPVEYSFSGTPVKRKTSDGSFRAYKNTADLKSAVRAILKDVPLKKTLFRDIEKDAQNISDRLNREVLQKGFSIKTIEILKPVFFRNKGAYVVGRIETGKGVLPLILPLLNEEHGIYADTALADEETANNIFSTVRANFHVRVDDYESIVDFMQSILPRRPRADFYSAIGFEIPAKVELMKELNGALRSDEKRFEKSEGHRGNVMEVFTLPDFPYTLKVIRDSSGQHSSPQAVMEKYEKVHEMDRVGRMLDPMYFQNLRFKESDFEPGLLEELKQSCSLTVVPDPEHGEIIIKNVYIQRKVTPLDVYLADTSISEDKKLRVLDDLARCARELALSGIFQGDYQAKNFGVTHFGRVVSYDYDGLVDLSEIQFKKLPEDNDDDPMAKQVYTYGYHDAFPEDPTGFMGVFLGSINIKPGYAEYFKSRHPYLFTVNFWKHAQTFAHTGAIPDFFPYRMDKRFAHTAASGARLAESYPEIKGETNWLRYRQIAATIRDFNVYRFFMLNKSLYRQRPYEPYPFSYESMTSPEFSDIAGADLQKDLGPDWKNVYEKARSNILKALQNRTIFKDGSEELTRHFAVVGVFTDTIFLAHNPSMKPYRKNVVRSSHGRPVIFVSIRYFADLNTDNAGEMNFAAFALKDAMDSYMRYDSLKNSSGLSHEEVAANLSAFRASQDKEEAHLVNKRLLRRFKEINGRDRSIMRVLRKLFSIEYDAFMKESAQMEAPDSAKTAEYLIKDSLIEGGKDDDKESLRKKFIDLQKKAIDLARRSFMVRRLEVTAKILSRMRENLLHLSIVDKGDIVMQRLAIYIIALARSGYYNELVWALRYLADGQMPSINGRSIAEEKQLFLSYARGLHMFQVVQSVLTRHMEAMTKEPNRKVVLEAQREAIQLMEKIGLTPDDGVPSPTASGSRLSSDGAGELTPLPLIDSGQSVENLVANYKNYEPSNYLKPFNYDENLYIGISLDRDGVNLEGILKTHHVQSAEETVWRTLSDELIIHDATNYRTRVGLIFEIPKAIQKRFSFRYSAPLNMTRRSWLVFYDKNERKYVFMQVTLPGKGLAIRRYFIEPHSLHDKAVYAQAIFNDAYEEMEAILNTRQNAASGSAADYLLDPVLRTWEQLADLEADAIAQNRSADLTDKIFRDKYSYLIKESKDSILEAVNRLTDDKAMSKEDLNLLLRLHGPVSRVIRTLSLLLKVVDISEIRSFGDPWPVPEANYQTADQNGEIYYTVNLERRMDPGQVTFQFYHPKVNEKGEVQIYDPWVAGEGILVEAHKEHPSIRYKYKLPTGVREYTVRAKAGGPKFEWLGYNILIKGEKTLDGSRLAMDEATRERFDAIRHEFPDLPPSQIRYALRNHPDGTIEWVRGLLTAENFEKIRADYPFIPQRKLYHFLLHHPKNTKESMDSNPVLKKWYGMDLRRLAKDAFFLGNTAAQDTLIKFYGPDTAGYVLPVPKNGRSKLFRYKNAQGKEAAVEIPVLRDLRSARVFVDRDEKGFMWLSAYPAKAQGIPRLIFNAYFDKALERFVYGDDHLHQRIVRGPDAVPDLPEPLELEAHSKQNSIYFSMKEGGALSHLSRPLSARYKGIGEEQSLQKIYVTVKYKNGHDTIYAFTEQGEEDTKLAIAAWRWEKNRKTRQFGFKNLYFFVPGTPAWYHAVLTGKIQSARSYYKKYVTGKKGEAWIFGVLTVRLADYYEHDAAKVPSEVLGVNSVEEPGRIDIYETLGGEGERGIFTFGQNRFIASFYYNNKERRLERSWKELSRRYKRFFENENAAAAGQMIIRLPQIKAQGDSASLLLLKHKDGAPLRVRSQHYAGELALVRFNPIWSKGRFYKSVELIVLDEHLLPVALLRRYGYDERTKFFIQIPKRTWHLGLTQTKKLRDEIFRIGFLQGAIGQTSGMAAALVQDLEKQASAYDGFGAIRDRFNDIFDLLDSQKQNALRRGLKHSELDAIEEWLMDIIRPILRPRSFMDDREGARLAVSGQMYPYKEVMGRVTFYSLYPIVQPDGSDEGFEFSKLEDIFSFFPDLDLAHSYAVLIRADRNIFSLKIYKDDLGGPLVAAVGLTAFPTINGALNDVFIGGGQIEKGKSYVWFEKILAALARRGFTRARVGIVHGEGRDLFKSLGFLDYGAGIMRKELTNESTPNGARLAANKNNLNLRIYNPVRKTPSEKEIKKYRSVMGVKKSKQDKKEGSRLAAKASYDPETIAANYRREGYFATLDRYELTPIQYGRKIAQFLIDHPDDKTDFYALTYEEAVKVISEPKSRKPFRTLQSKTTAKNLILASLDTIDGFRSAREAGNIKEQAALYRRHVLRYQTERVTNKKHTYSQIDFFTDRGGLRGLMQKKYFPKSDSPAELLRLALPDLIDVRNPDALNPIEVERHYWTDADNLRYHVLVALDAVDAGAFAEARARQDIEAMADLYRRFVKPYRSHNNEYPNGQTGFFYEQAGLRGVMAIRLPYLSKTNSASELVKLAVPGLIDDSNPQALKTSEVERPDVSQVSGARLVSEIDVSQNLPVEEAVSVLGRVIERYRRDSQTNYDQNLRHRIADEIRDNLVLIVLKFDESDPDRNITHIALAPRWDRKGRSLGHEMLMESLYAEKYGYVRVNVRFLNPPDNSEADPSVPLSVTIYPRSNQTPQATKLEFLRTALLMRRILEKQYGIKALRHTQINKFEALTGQPDEELEGRNLVEASDLAGRYLSGARLSLSDAEYARKFSQVVRLLDKMKRPDDKEKYYVVRDFIRLQKKPLMKVNGRIPRPIEIIVGHLDNEVFYPKRRAQIVYAFLRMPLDLMEREIYLLLRAASNGKTEEGLRQGRAASDILSEMLRQTSEQRNSKRLNLITGKLRRESMNSGENSAYRAVARNLIGARLTQQTGREQAPRMQAPLAVESGSTPLPAGARLAGRFAVGSPSWFKTLDVEGVPARDFGEYIVPTEQLVRQRMPTVFKIFLNLYVHAHVFFLSSIEAVLAAAGFSLVTFFYSKKALYDHTHNFRFLRTVSQYRREMSWKEPMRSILESLWKYLDDPELAQTAFVPLLFVSNYVPDLAQALKNRRDLEDKVDAELYQLLFLESNGARLAQEDTRAQKIEREMSAIIENLKDLAVLSETLPFKGVDKYLLNVALWFQSILSAFKLYPVAESYVSLPVDLGRVRHDLEELQQRIEHLGEQTGAQNTLRTLLKNMDSLNESLLQNPSGSRLAGVPSFTEQYPHRYEIGNMTVYSHEAIGTEAGNTARQSLALEKPEDLLNFLPDLNASQKLIAVIQLATATELMVDLYKDEEGKKVFDNPDSFSALRAEMSSKRLGNLELHVRQANNQPTDSVILSPGLLNVPGQTTQWIHKIAVTLRNRNFKQLESIVAESAEKYFTGWTNRGSSRFILDLNPPAPAAAENLPIINGKLVEEKPADIWIRSTSRWLASKRVYNDGTRVQSAITMGIMTDDTNENGFILPATYAQYEGDRVTYRHYVIRVNPEKADLKELAVRTGELVEKIYGHARFLEWKRFISSSGARFSVFKEEALSSFFRGIAVAHAAEIKEARLPLTLDKTYIFKISVNGSRLSAVAEGMTPVEFDIKKSKDVSESKADGSRLSIADLRRLTNEAQSKVDADLAAVNISSDKTVLLKINLDFINNASYTLYIDELLRVLNKFKESKDGQNVLFQVTGSEHLVAYALSSAENKSVLTRELPADAKDAAIVQMNPAGIASAPDAVNVPVDLLQEGDLPVFRSIVKLSVFAGRIDLSAIPDNFRDAYSTLSSQAIDSATLLAILKGRASVEIVRQFALRAITKVPLQQLFQFFRLQKKIEQSA